MSNTQEIKPIAMPGTHRSFLKYFRKQGITKDKKILDLGAGHGAMTYKLHDQGYDMAACDLFPENFMFDEVKCDKADITRDLPYSDNTFDVVIAVEVSEHINGHDNFFREINRILKPGGILFLSTPNILSFKSRVRFLFRGFFYSFGPLEHGNFNGLQHIASLTLDQYNYIAQKNNFAHAEFEIDKKQSTSRVLQIMLFPAFLLHTLLVRHNKNHNSAELQLGRLLLMRFESLKK